jgi:hypothetical protein
LEVAVRFFTFETDGEYNGLIRRTETEEGLILERMDVAGAWIDDPNLNRHFVAGNVDLVEIGEAEAWLLQSVQ